MDSNQEKSRAQLKDRLLKLLKAGVTGGLLLASTTLNVASLDASTGKSGPRSLDERVADLKKLDVGQTELGNVPGGDPASMLVWGNWGNWHNGWGNGWHNWHNWHNW